MSILFKLISFVPTNKYLVYLIVAPCIVSRIGPTKCALIPMILLDTGGTSC
jgi:hypothetical protein